MTVYLTPKDCLNALRPSVLSLLIIIGLFLFFFNGTSLNKEMLILLLFIGIIVFLFKGAELNKETLKYTVPFLGFLIQSEIHQIPGWLWIWLRIQQGKKFIDPKSLPAEKQLCETTLILSTSSFFVSLLFYVVILILNRHSTIQLSLSLVIRRYPVSRLHFSPVAAANY